MMDFVFALAWKSLLLAGLALLVLKAMAGRSAGDRSLVAHLGLAAILLLPFASLLMPPLEVAAPAALDQVVEAGASLAPSDRAPEVAADRASFPIVGEPGVTAGVDLGFWFYAAPAGLLVLLTLIALGRLVLLKSNASVLVDSHWLTALARAQRRIGFKHGTALLTSEELTTPISWGVVRPVILLNREAAEARHEAEAIIAHELAHVAHFDWAKLLLSRLTVALFWFNPLVWLLSREAHQLREEAADDAVLGSDIDETEYAQLLVGIARHECRGLLLGAHGVAPGRNSLARRVRRVLDGALTRAPGGWRWTSAVAFFAAGMAVPVAALEFIPANAAPSPSAIVADSPQPERALRASVPELAAAPTAAPQAAAVLSQALAEPAVRETAATEPSRSSELVAQSGSQLAAIDVPANGNVTMPPQRLELSQVDEPVTAVDVRHGGMVVLRYGATPRVRVIGGDPSKLSVSFDRGSLSVSCAGGCARNFVEVTTSRVQALAVQGGGTITVGGGYPVAETLALAVNGGGTIDARALRADMVAASTRGGGTILTFAQQTLAASTNGGGTIRHWGQGNVASSVRGGGRIEPGGT